MLGAMQADDEAMSGQSVTGPNLVRTSLSWLGLVSDTGMLASLSLFVSAIHGARRRAVADGSRALVMGWPIDAAHPGSQPVMPHRSYSKSGRRLKERRLAGIPADAGLGAQPARPTADMLDGGAPLHCQPAQPGKASASLKPWRASRRAAPRRRSGGAQPLLEARQPQIEGLASLKFADATASAVSTPTERTGLMRKAQMSRDKNPVEARRLDPTSAIQRRIGPGRLRNLPEGGLTSPSKKTASAPCGASAVILAGQDLDAERARWRSRCGGPFASQCTRATLKPRKERRVLCIGVPHSTTRKVPAGRARRSRVNELKSSRRGRGRASPAPAPPR